MAATVASDQGPADVSVPSLDLVRAISALADPVVRNLQITQAYHELAVAMSRFTGPGANWCTFATWASKQAGQSIRREDLSAAFERLLRDVPQVEESASAVLDASAVINGAAPRSLAGAVDALWSAINPAAAFDRTSDAVGQGNLKVFAEIGAEFARFLALCAGAPPSDAALAAFLEGLRPGDPPGGQRYLRQAFAHYAHASLTADPKAKAELLLLANLEIGFHEQTRLQPEIVEAMNAPVVDPKVLRKRLVVELFPDPRSRIRYWLRRAAQRMDPFLAARDRLAEEAQAVGRRVVTVALMTITLPPDRVLWLGRALPGRFPEVLATLTSAELLALLKSVGAGADNDTASGAAGPGITPGATEPAGTDWSNLQQRMRYIADLFRAYHVDDALLDAPFTAPQVADIWLGRRPSGPL